MAADAKRSSRAISTADTLEDILRPNSVDDRRWTELSRVLRLIVASLGSYS
jgi:hypothetical protein